MFKPLASPDGPIGPSGFGVLYQGRSSKELRTGERGESLLQKKGFLGFQNKESRKLICIYICIIYIYIYKKIKVA